MNWNNIGFFPFQGKLIRTQTCLKIMLRGLKIESPHIFNI